MPELPEVEGFRSLLVPLVGSKISSVSFPSPTPPRKFLSEEERKSIEGCVLKAADRKGKLIYITLALSGSKNVRDITEKNSNHRYLLLHMGMTGRISSPLSVPTLISLPANDSYPPPHTHLTLKTNTGEASFSDPRRFGSVSLQSSMDEVDGLSPDALSFEINSAAELLQGNRKGVKEILLDQKKCVSGVGNWVADEVCYQCEMHPNQTNLGREDCVRILEKVKEICTTAVACGSLPYPGEWLFHFRWTKASPKDAYGRNITFVTSGGRTSAIVPCVQKIVSKKRLLQNDDDERGPSTAPSSKKMKDGKKNGTKKGAKTKRGKK